MLELILKLELLRCRLRKEILSTVGSNGYTFIGTVLALIFSVGTLGTAFISAPVAIPSGGLSFVILIVTGVLSMLSIVLLPLGLILV